MYLQNILATRSLDATLQEYRNHKSADALTDKALDRLKFTGVSLAATIQTVALTALDALATTLKLLTIVFYNFETWQNFSDYVSVLSDTKYAAASAAWISAWGALHPDYAVEMTQKKVDYVNAQPKKSLEDNKTKFDNALKEKDAQYKAANEAFNKLSDAEKIKPENAVLAQNLYDGIKTEIVNLYTDEAVLNLDAAGPLEKYTALRSGEKNLNAVLKEYKAYITELPLKQNEWSEYEYYFVKQQNGKLAKKEYDQLNKILDQEYADKVKDVKFDAKAQAAFKNARKTAMDNLQKEIVELLNNSYGKDFKEFGAKTDKIKDVYKAVVAGTKAKIKATLDSANNNFVAATPPPPPPGDDEKKVEEKKADGRLAAPDRTPPPPPEGATPSGKKQGLLGRVSSKLANVFN